MNEARIQRRLAAIVAADVAGYSKLMGADEEGTLSALQGHLKELVNPSIAELGGRIVKTTGDGFLAEFPSVVAAVRCCLDLQQAMLARNRDVPSDRRIQFRMGVNLGDIIIEDDDIFGDGVNVAARLEGEAIPGGICISQSVLDQVRRKLTLDLEDLGERSLKNIEEPVRTYRIKHSGLTSRPAPAANGDDARIGSLPAPSQRPSLAIMPFRNLSAEPGNDYVASGICLGIQTMLVRLPGLFLVNAARPPERVGGQSSAAAALRELPVQYALEGAVQRSGDRVRVSVQLTDLKAGQVLWADHLDRDLEDVFALQDEVAKEVISALGSEIHGGNLDRIWTRQLTGQGAWEFFLRGVSHLYQSGKDNNRLARENFEKLHELHPESGIAPGYIAATYWRDAIMGWADERDRSIDLARLWAEKAVRARKDPTGLGEVVLGSISLREGRHEEALELCRKGASQRASCPMSLGLLADAELHCGLPGQAIKSARDAISLQTIYPPQLIDLLAAAYRDNGQLDLSIPAAREAARLEPERTEALVTLCSDYALAGQTEQARRIAAEIVATDPGFRISAYAADHPYRDQSHLAGIVGALRSAGLPG